MDYNSVFTHRASSYIFAIQKYPHVMEEEFRTAAAMCQLKETDTLIHIPGACENVVQYIPKGVTYLPFETNKVLGTMMNVPICTFSSIPSKDTSVDKVLSLASLHHLTDEERTVFYKEVKRILRPSGMFIIGDVGVGSKEAEWLNVFVDKYNPLGHCGKFWDTSDIQLLKDVGFDVDMEIKSYHWNFPDKDSMIEFCKYLFGLDKATDEEIVEGLVKYVDVDFIKCRFKWELVYFTAKVSPVFSLCPMEKT